MHIQIAYVIVAGVAGFLLMLIYTELAGVAQRIEGAIGKAFYYALSLVAVLALLALAIPGIPTPLSPLWARLGIEGVWALAQMLSVIILAVLACLVHARASMRTA